jgi:hypothetical protein
MADTHVLLQKIDVGPYGAASVTFDNIPQTGYTDLVVVTSTRNDASWPAGEHRIFFNGSTSNFSSRALYGTGNAGTGSYSTNVAIPAYSNGGTSTANIFGSATFYIPNYTSSNFKSVSSESVFEDNAAQASQYLVAGLWSDTAAITSITFVTSNNSSGVVANFVANSTFSLYGVSKLGVAPTLAPKATGGDIIETDGTYWYHAFETSGSFKPLTSMNADVLVIAGGGGGSAFGGGGGGAGGVIYFASSALTANTGYTTIVGSGGAGYTNGTDSKFGALTAAVGGGGANNPGNAGGSGGGCGQGSGATTAGGASTQTGTGATAFYGNAGGSATNSQNFVGGGGGGAGAAGTSPGGTGRGNGGVGTLAFSSWGVATGTGHNVSGTVYYAGGGGGSSYFNPATSGGSGGAGGGGNGCTVSEPSKNNTPGAANTGGGGGAVQSNQAPDSNCNGGSGIIIVRYAV